jgi:hypothetical protein
MEPTKQPQERSKYDYTSLFIAAMFLMTTSQGLESMQTPLGHFFRGVAIGLSIVCSLVGMALYIQAHNE